MNDARIIFRLPAATKKQIEDDFNKYRAHVKAQYYENQSKLSTIFDEKGKRKSPEDAYYDCPRSISAWWVQCAAKESARLAGMVPTKKGGKK
jgi:hypothetical protein